MMMKRFFNFISLLTLILTIAALYIGNRINNWLELSSTCSIATYVILVLVVFFQISSFLFRRFYSDFFGPKGSIIFNYLSYLTLGIFTSLFFYILAADIVIIFWSWAISWVNYKLAFWIVMAIVIFSTIIGILQAIFGPKIYKINIKIKNLPQSFDGFTIAHISDLHVGSVIGAKYTKKIVDLTNKLNPDMIALTGDMIDGTTEDLYEKIAPIANLKAKNGVYFVPGNHEYYWNAVSWINQFSRFGFQCLINQNTLILKNNEQILIGGITDYEAGWIIKGHTPNLKKAAANISEPITKILLSHQPKSYKEAEEAGFDLQLSGHTHGGQFFPWSLIIALAQPYYKGLGKYKNMSIYTNRGTGFWGPPFRFGVPSEITFIKLKKSI